MRFIAGIDDAGVVTVLTWPGFERIAAVPAAVSAAPVQCLAFAEGGATLVALRVSEGPTPAAEFLRWRPGETALLERATADLSSPVRAPSGPQCLFARKQTNMSDSAVMAMLEPAGADPEASATVLHWNLLNPFLLSLPPSPVFPAASVKAWANALAGELDHNRGPVVLLRDGSIVRNTGGAERKTRIDSKASRFTAMAAGGGWIALATGLDDPYVPLLKSTRFDIVDTQTGAVMQSVGNSGGSALFTPDTATLITLSGTRLRLWDRRDGSERLRLMAQAPVERVLIDDSSRHLAALSADGALEVFDIGAADERMRAADTVLIQALGQGERFALASGQRLVLSAGEPRGMPVELALDRHVNALQASPNGRWLALNVSKDKPWIGEAPDAELWIVQTTPTPAVRYRGKWARQLRFDRASRMLWAVTETGQARLIDLNGARTVWDKAIELPPPKTHTAPTDNGLGVALSDDAKTLVVASVDGATVLSAQDGQILKRMDRATGHAVALSPDGGLLAMMSPDQQIEVTRIADGHTVQRLKLQGSPPVRALAFSPGGRMLMATVGDPQGTFVGGRFHIHEGVLLWDVQTGTLVHRVPEGKFGPGDYQASIGAAADERMYIGALTWNTQTREIAATVYPSMLAYWTVPSGLVRGQLVAWRLTDAGLVETYRAQGGESLTPKELGAGGGMLLVHGPDGIRRMIDLSSSHLHGLRCSVVRRSLTDDERRATLGAWSSVAAPCAD